MTLAVVFHPLAELELEDAVLYYEHESSGLGRAFLTEFRLSLEWILAHPSAGTPIVEALRRRSMSRSPYALIYQAAPTHLYVLAVANHHRRPFYWGDRQAR